MTSKTLRRVGSHALRLPWLQRHNPFAKLDPRLGMKMMVDINVASGPKALALAIGVFVTMALMLIEAPVELVFLAVPGLGFGLDLLVDGAEAIFAPALIACMVLPLLVDRRSRFLHHAEERLPYVED
jgi:hypothetical protein